MRKCLLSGILTALLVCLFTFSVSAETIQISDQGKIKIVVFKIGDSNYYVEDDTGIISTTKMDVAPYIKSSRTFVPVRYLSNALGLSDNQIAWDGNTGTVTLTGNKTVNMVIGSKEMQSDGQKIIMDVAPELTNGRTMLLTRYVAEGLGYIVDWDANRQLVICYPEDKPKPDLTKIIEVIEKKPVPGSVEARFEGIGKTGGFTKPEQLTDEMANYILEIAEWTANITVSETTWEKHKKLITVQNLGDIRVNDYTYKVNTVVPTRVGARRGVSYGWQYIGEDDIDYVVVVNGKMLCKVNITYNEDAKLAARWMGTGVENIFIEGSGVPEWTGIHAD